MKIKKVGICLISALFMLGCQEKDDPYRSWDVYKGDSSSSSYSSLAQINKENVNQLEIAWIYRTGDLIEDYFPSQGIEANPIIVNDIVYGTSPYIKVFAVDAATGEELWMFDPFEGGRAVDKNRGLTYWEDGDDKRIFVAAGTWLHALNAETGELITDFGQEGRINMNEGLGRDPESLFVKANSPGIIYRDLIIMGSAGGEAYGSAPGHIRAYDVRTGEMAWIFNTIPEPGEPGFETWKNQDEEALNNRGGANNWAGMSLDEDRGIVYVPLGSATYDFYGGDRPGENLYANSLLALDAATGRYIWHYQTVRHDIWDYDLPAPPNLLTVERNGEKIDVVAQITKQGFTFVFNRETGEPIFPIEDKPVPPSRLEETWPTQPFPLKPEPFARQNFTVDEVTDISPESHEYIMSKFDSFNNEGLFTPHDPDRETIFFPTTSGAGRWGGAAHDPESGIFFVNASELIQVSSVHYVEVQSTDDDPLIVQGHILYIQHCATCHGTDRSGQPPIYPSLRNLVENSSRQEALNIIETGGSMMPAFPMIADEDKNTIIEYLFDEQDRIAELQNIYGVPELGGDSQQIVRVTRRYLRDQDGYPALKPPWGTLNAIDLNTGEYKWTIPLGVHPELIEKGIPPTGTPSMGGPIVTAGGLVFIAGTADKQFRAFDKDTGEMLFEYTLPTAGFATPATYMIDGKQYVIIAAGGGRGTEPGDYYVAFSLPD